MKDRQRRQTKPGFRRSDRVYEQLYKEITSGVILPGAALREQEICDRLGISRTPVREALNRLAVDGVVESIPNAGVYVKVFSMQDVDDMYRLRAALESMAARMACERGFDTEKLERMRRAQEVFKQGIASGDRELIKSGDLEFHRQLVGLCESRVLAEVLTRNNVHILGWRSLTVLNENGRLVQAVQDHDQLIHALDTRNCELAVKTCEQHILDTSRMIQQILRERQEQASDSLSIIGGIQVIRPE